MATFFSDYFGIDKETLDEYGAFNVSLVNDLPLFIDPFLLFQSDNPTYRALHDQIIRYLVFLRDRAATEHTSEEVLRVFYCFPEVKQNWLGFSEWGNGGAGLGIDFARALQKNLRIFNDFGSESVTHGSHLEKVCLIRSGVGRDNISDFTTNLIKDFLCSFTEAFAAAHLDAQHVRSVAIDKAYFDYDRRIWCRRLYNLPWINGDYVLLTPKDILTRDENWINHSDMVTRFEEIPIAVSDTTLRAQVSEYFKRALIRHRDREPTRKERAEAAAKTILQFPQLLDYYIRLKEEAGADASSVSADKVTEAERVFIAQLGTLQQALLHNTSFYAVGGGTYEEAHARLAYLKDIIENKGGHRIFYHNGKALEREKDLHVLYRLVWFGTPTDVGAEVNDGRGPVDYKLSRGAFDKTLVEMKLAKNTQLARNLEKQAEVYQAASDAPRAIKVIIFFTAAEEERVALILARLKLSGHRDIVLIDARPDNKPSGSKA